MQVLNLVARACSICVGLALLVAGSLACMAMTGGAPGRAGDGSLLLFPLLLGLVALFGSGFFYVGLFASGATWTGKRRSIAGALLLFPLVASALLAVVPTFSESRPVMLPLLGFSVAALLFAVWPAATLKSPG